MAPDVTITSVHFRFFKAFSDFSVSFEPMNILVGPNNSGKSTIIGVFRVLATAIQRARQRNPVQLAERGGVLGYRIPWDSIPISLENAQTNYQDVESVVTFRLSNGNSLILIFPPNGQECLLLPEAYERGISRPSEFKAAFPIAIAPVPVLGPVEHEEAVVQLDTVKRNLATHRASRNFRNYWHHNINDFDSFRETVKATWPGMDIQAPELLGNRKFLSMFSKEDRIDRELYWTGFGFQVWCQLLTHISRSAGATILVIDEPDIYLHPDLQRQLIALLRESGPDILLATHSTDIIGEADPTDILVVDKNQRSAKRVKGPEGIGRALEFVGSVHNFALTQIERAGRVLFVEGNDFTILRRFARRIGLPELATGTGLVPFPLGGFPSTAQLRGVTQGIRGTLAARVVFGGVFDRDFRSNEEIATIKQDMKRVLKVLGIHERKEIENYLLVPSVLDRALQRALRERARRLGTSIGNPENMHMLLDKITQGEKASLQAQYIAKRLDYLNHSRKDISTITRETIETFEGKWNDINKRMDIVGGKQTLGALVSYVQQTYGVNLTTAKIIDAFGIAEVPADLLRLLRELDSFRVADPAGTID